MNFLSCLCKKFYSKYLAKIFSLPEAFPYPTYGNVVRTNATKCIAHMSRPKGTKDRRRQKASV